MTVLQITIAGWSIVAVAIAVAVVPIVVVAVLVGIVLVGGLDCLDVQRDVALLNWGHGSSIRWGSSVCSSLFEGAIFDEVIKHLSCSGDLYLVFETVIVHLG